jgi:hypothetical protein
MVRSLAVRSGLRNAARLPGIEPFAGHVQVDAEAKRRIQPLVERVQALLPPTEEFELQVPIDGLAAPRGKKLDDAHDALADWIGRIAPTLPIAPIGLPKRLHLNLIVRDVEARRLERLRKALADKRAEGDARWRMKAGLGARRNRGDRVGRA